MMGTVRAPELQHIIGLVNYSISLAWSLKEAVNPANMYESDSSVAGPKCFVSLRHKKLFRKKTFTQIAMHGGGGYMGNVSTSKTG